MTGRRDRWTLEQADRRRVLQRLGAAAATVATSRALADQADDPLQQLIQQNQRGDMGQGFDSSSRTIAMPKASLPTLSPANIPTTEAAVARYEQIATPAPAGQDSREPSPGSASAPRM